MKHCILSLWSINDLKNLPKGIKAGRRKILWIFPRNSIALLNLATILFKQYSNVNWGPRATLRGF